MRLISYSEAENKVINLKDRLGKPVDQGITEALIHCTRFVQALGFETSQSCEGHIDWSFPFPWIEFCVPHTEVKVPAAWQVWKLRNRTRAILENTRHKKNEEEKIDQFCTMMTKYLLEYKRFKNIPIESHMHVYRWNPFRFRLQPTYSWLSEGYKKQAIIKSSTSYSIFSGMYLLLLLHFVLID